MTRLRQQVLNYSHAGLSRLPRFKTIRRSRPLASHRRRTPCKHARVSPLSPAPDETFAIDAGFAHPGQSSMNARSTTSPFLQHNRLGRDHPRLGAIIEFIDTRLRARAGVYEYSASPECIFRIQIIDSREAVELSDGTRVSPGDRIIDVHLWNEQLPIIAKHGATLAWGRRMTRALELSLRELAIYLKARRDLNSVVALRANMSFGSAERSEQITGIAARYGFERSGPVYQRSIAERLHCLGENVLISLMVIARNTAAFRLESLGRIRTPVYMSRRKLESRFRNRDGGVPTHRSDSGSAGQATS